MARQGTGDSDNPDHLRPQEAIANPPADTGGAPAYRVTVQQLDALDRSLQMIAAHGDLLAISQPSELAPGTLAVIGQAIHEDAGAMRGILDQVEFQRSGRTIDGVEEARAGYAVGPLRLVAHVSPHPVGWIGRGRVAFGGGRAHCATIPAWPACLSRSGGTRRLHAAADPTCAVGKLALSTRAVVRATRVRSGDLLHAPCDRRRQRRDRPRGLNAAMSSASSSSSA